MWSHDEQKEINDGYAVMARITCKHCGAIVHKYVESHYTGGAKCVILAKYCRFCGNALRIQERKCKAELLAFLDLGDDDVDISSLGDFEEQFIEFIKDDFSCADQI